VGQYTQNRVQEVVRKGIPEEIRIPINVNGRGHRYFLLSKEILEKFSISEKGFYRMVLKEGPRGKLREFFFYHTGGNKKKISADRIIADKVTILTIKNFTIDDFIREFNKRYPKYYGVILERINGKIAVNFNNKFRKIVDSYLLKVHGGEISLILDLEVAVKRLKFVMTLNNMNASLKLLFGKETTRDIIGIKPYRNFVEIRYIKPLAKSKIHIATTYIFEKEPHINRFLEKLKEEKEFYKNIRIFNKGNYLDIRYILCEEATSILKLLFIETEKLPRGERNIAREKIGLTLAEKILKELGWTDFQRYPFSDSKTRRGPDLLAAKEKQKYLFEIKICEPSFMHLSLKRGLHEVQRQVQTIYRKEVKKLEAKYIGVLVIGLKYIQEGLFKGKIFLKYEEIYENDSSK